MFVCQPVGGNSGGLFTCADGLGYMEHPSTLTDALAALSAAQADLAALNALTAEHSALVANFDSLKARAAQLTDALDAANANNRDLAAMLDAAKAAEADAAAKANAIVANLGVDPVAIVPEQSVAPKTKAELWAHYQTLGFVERNAFFAENKDRMKL
jgi:predicted TIM-barrel fold metal-dependent hydrolase